MTTPTMAKLNADIKWDELQAAFPEDARGLLPRAKFDKKDPKGECTGDNNARGDGRTCGKYHVLPAVHLDYVGHAAVTERLNTVAGVDGWDWEPMSMDSNGLPLITEVNGEANLWIFLTIGDVTKKGNGTCAKGRTDRDKVLIGDALRNAAMRFGIALEMWNRDRHVDEDDDPPTVAETKRQQPQRRPEAPRAADEHQAAYDNVLKFFEDDAGKADEAFLKALPAVGVKAGQRADELQARQLLQLITGDAPK